MTSLFSFPNNMRIYAVGDIHGHLDALEHMHHAIQEDLECCPIDNVKIVYIGDYIDRGPDSKGVIDCLLKRELHHPGIEHIFIRGNHENTLQSFLKHPHDQGEQWLQYGGIDTLASYGVNLNLNKPFSQQLDNLALALNHAMPLSHQEFLKNLVFYYKLDDYLFVHAGIRPGISLELQKKRDMMMIREPFLSHEDMHPWRVVHGHTISQKPEILPNRINTDTGLYQHGVLTSAVIESDKVRVLQVVK